MSSCRIVRDSNRNVVKVNTKEGKESNLFSKISRLPILTQDQKLKVYEQALKASNNKDDVNISFYTDKHYNTYSEALRSNKGNITVKVEGSSVCQISASTNKKTVGGMINSLIKDNVLSDRAYNIGGKTKYEALGKDTVNKRLNMAIAMLDANDNLKGNIATIEDHMLVIEEEKAPSDEVKLFNSILKEMNDKQGTTLLTDEQLSRKERTLKNKLVDILTDMGVSLMSIDSYTKRAEAKDVKLGVEALTDVVNRIVAIKEGGVDLSVLSEEVSHLIVETLSTEEINSLLEGIETTPEYLEHYKHYKDVYGDSYTAKKEVLGKVMKNQITRKTEGGVKRLLDKVLNFFKNLVVTKNNVYDLNNVNGLVDDYIFNKEFKSLNANSLNNSKQVDLMYSLGNVLTDAYKPFGSLLQKVSKHDFNEMKSFLKDNNFESLDKEQMIEVTVKLTNLADRLSRVVNKALEKTDREGGFIDKVDKDIVDDLYNHIDPILASLKSEITLLEGDRITTKEKNSLVSNITTISDRIVDLNRKKNEIADMNFLLIKNETFSKIPEGANKRYLERQLEKAIKGELDDVNVVLSYVTQLHHSANPLVQMIGYKILEGNINSNKYVMESTATIRDYMAKNKDVVAKFNKDCYSVDGVMEEYDRKAFENKLAEESYKIYVKETGSTIRLDEFKEVLSDKSKDLEFENDFQKGNYLFEVKTMRADYQEQPLLPQYYKDIKKLYDSLGITGYTKQYLTILSSKRTAIRERGMFIDEFTGKRVFQATAGMRQELADLSRDRKEMKSLYDSVGTLKEGFRILDAPVGTENVDYILDNDGTAYVLDLEGVSEEKKAISQVAFDLRKIDNQHKIENEKELQKKLDEGLSKEEALRAIEDSNWKSVFNFLTQLDSHQDIAIEDKIVLLKDNLNLELTPLYYEEINKQEQLDDYASLNPGKEKEIAALKQLMRRKANLLAKRKDPHDPLEITQMTENEISLYKDIVESIRKAKKGLKSPKMEFSSTTKKTVNKAYLAELERINALNNSARELDFLKQHMNVSSLEYFEKVLDKKKKGLPLSENEVNMIDTHGEGLSGLISFGRANINTYYARFAPENYKTLDEILRDTEDPVRDLEIYLKDMYYEGYVRARVDYTYSMEESKYANKDYVPRKGAVTPKGFRNEKYYDYFGIGSDGKVTKNKDVHEYRKIWLDLNSLIDDQNEKRYNDPHKAIQISSTQTNKIIRLLKEGDKKETVKEIFADIFKYRTEELMQGEEGFNNTKQLPRYYYQDIENQKDLSMDSYFAIIAKAERAAEYKAKKEVIRQVEVLNDKLISSNRNNDNKNILSQARALIDAQMYGNKEERKLEFNVPGVEGKVDLTKFVRVVRQFSSLINLGFTLITPITSYAMGKSALKVESMVGEVTNPEAMKLATRDYWNLLKDAANDSLDVVDNSEMYKMMASFGLADLSHASRNSNLGKFLRSMGKTAMGAHAIADFPISGKMMLAILHDNRFIKTKEGDYVVMTRKQFMQQRGMERIGVAEAMQEWKESEKNAVRHHMEFKASGIEWKETVTKDFNFNHYQKTQLMTQIGGSVQLECQRITMNIPEGMKVRAQQDVLASLAMQHKGFLAVQGQRLLGTRHLNPFTKNIEEGTLLTMTRLMGKMVLGGGNAKERLGRFRDALNKPKPKTEFIEEYIKARNVEGVDIDELRIDAEDAYGDAYMEYELTRVNAERFVKQFMVFSMLAGISAYFMKGVDDDEDDSYSMAMTKFILYRIAAESSSQYAGGYLFDTFGSIESPFAATGTVKHMLFNFADVFDSDKVASGKYRGLTKRERYFTKITPIRKFLHEIKDARTIKESMKSYKMFNEQKLNWSTLGAYEWYLNED